MKFPTIEEMAKEVAVKAMDEYEIDGKTLRQWINEIEEYYIKKEQGKLLIIPCKPGDTVYVISNYSNYKKNGYEIIKAIVSNIRVKDDCKTVSFTCRGKWKNQNPYIGNFTSNSVSKTVFLTEQEAKEALEGMKE